MLVITLHAETSHALRIAGCDGDMKIMYRYNPRRYDSYDGGVEFAIVRIRVGSGWRRM